MNNAKYSGSVNFSLGGGGDSFIDQRNYTCLACGTQEIPLDKDEGIVRFTKKVCVGTGSLAVSIYYPILALIILLGFITRILVVLLFQSSPEMYFSLLLRLGIHNPSQKAQTRTPQTPSWDPTS